jgi:hypothetical protein
MSDKLKPSEVKEEEISESRPVHSEDPTSASVQSPVPVRPSKWKARIATITKPLARLHQNTPYLRRVPTFVILPITILVIVQGVVWAIVGIILAHHPYRHRQFTLMIAH